MRALTILFCTLLCCTLRTTAQLPQPSERDESGPKPSITELLIAPGVVSDLHLRPNFVTTIRMPEPVRDVIVGSPTLFLTEHSERDPELVTVKPITEHPATSNLLISTQSGHQVSLRLINAGATSTTEAVDYVLIYRLRRDFLIPSDDLEPQ